MNALAAAILARPRHAILAAAVAGLLAGPRSPAAVAALVLAALTYAAAASRRAPAVDSFDEEGEVASPPDSAWSPDASASPDAATKRAALPGGPALALGVAVAVLVGAVVAEARIAALDRSVLVPAERVEVRGWVTEAPRVRSFGARVFPVEIAAGRGVGEKVLVRVPARVGAPPFAIGDGVAVRGRLRALTRHEAFERRRGRHAVLEAERVVAAGVRRDSLLDRIRTRAEQGVERDLRPEQAALARGMVLGQDEALPSDLRDAFRASGLAHLVAASGQNVMLLAALVIGLATFAGVGLHGRLALALAAVVLYVPLAGAGPSIQRAGVMGAAGLVAAMAGRPASRWYAILLAAAATLALNPRAAEEPGWQLSFAAVVAIFLLHRRIVAALQARGVPRPLGEAIALTTAATAGTAPLLSLHFGELSLVSLPANVLAVPAVAPVMWLGAIAGLAGGEIASLCNAVATLPLAYLAWLGRSAAALPNASVPLALPGPLALVAVYAAIAALTLGWKRWSRVGAKWLRGRGGGRDFAASLRGRLVAAGVALVVALGWSALGRAEPPAGFRVSFLDVGQGDATLVQHGRWSVLVDTGPPGAPVLAELRAAGVERLDALFVTHQSADHDGNAAAILAAMPVGLLLDGSGGVRAPAHVRRIDPRAGQALRVGPLRFDLVWPPPDLPRSRDDPNETATVAVLTSGAHSVLLTADAESPVLLPLDLPDVDLLKVSHHGSEDAGLPDLLRQVQPEIAVVPVGRNTYGHPAPSTMAALTAVPDVRRVDRDGTVRVVPGEGGRLVVE